MTTDNYYQVFLFGVLGGILGELPRWNRLRTSIKLPMYIKRPVYWIITVILIMAGGIVSILYGAKQINAVMAVNLGMTAPLLINSIVHEGNERQNKSQTLMKGLTTSNEKLSFIKNVINFLGV